MHLSTIITHLTHNQSQIKCSVVAGQPWWDHASRKQAIADRKSEKLMQQWSQAITLLLHVYTSECMHTHVTMCTILNNTLTQLANIQQNHDLFQLLSRA